MGGLGTPPGALHRNFEENGASRTKARYSGFHSLTIFYMRRRESHGRTPTRAEVYASTATKRARRRRVHDDVGRLPLVGDAEGPAGAAGRAGVGRVAGPLRGRVPAVAILPLR